MVLEGDVSDIRCNCGTLACRIDDLLHRIGWHIRWICDHHDRQILGHA